ncbi:cytidylate kinase [Candidatus Collierbacteria bacterium CG17_big_fil_post_rev_8_21_14_2_50_45_7]|uniref:Cytidylate kinase n=2 Tax=Candidatus Collieribacteriota TaxID=1752725 RepID=A0A2M7FM61_9BACT|nr:MAG: cytidylate kinase [Candidatus Collierbacteria bacterium CG17_big_fil_post_rev_8_21_14_2_50_45_7]
MDKTFQIAIDGPVAAGKGTTAKMVAARLGFLYVDTGAMYRALTLYSIRHDVDWGSESEVIKLIDSDQPSVELKVPVGDTHDGRLCTVLLNGEDVSWKIRTEEISHAVSPVAQYPKVRDYVNKLARKMANEQGVVMEGRDITGVVLPDANLKIYMDADPMERTARRHRELMSRGEDVSLDVVYRELVERDQRDMQKNLKKVPGVWVLDTTGMGIDQVADVIVAKVEEMQ